jgi:putative ABC transport system permease protein
MWRIRRFVRRLVNAVRPAAADPELAREIASHLALLEDEYRRRGLSPEAARRAARVAFGGVERVKEVQRDARSFPVVDDTRRDVQYAVRTLRRTPVFTAVAVLTIALAIGANSAVFTVLYAVLLRPLPYPEPARLVGIVQQHTQYGPDFATWPDYTDWRDGTTTLESVGGAWSRVYNLTGVEEPERLSGAAVTPRFFATLGVPPAIGRTFAVDGSDSPRTLVLGHGLWSRRFASAPDVIGRVVSLNGQSHTIVGVMPAGFAWPESAELWVPFILEPNGMNRGYHLMQVVGRMKPDATLSSVRAELTAIAGRSAAQFPSTNAGWGVSVASLLDYTVNATRRPLLILMGAAGCVLLIACANIAGLLTARAVGRRDEIALRRALGASSARIVRQLLAESLLLSFAGGALGLVLAAWSVPRLLALTTLPRAAHISLDLPVFAATFIAAAVTGLVFGLGPALSASRDRLTEGVASRATGAIGRLRPALLVVEVAVAVVLLTGAGLLLRTFHNLYRVETGIEVDRLLTVRFFLPRASYPVERCIALYREMIERMRALPGVDAAAATSVFPFANVSANVVFSILTRPPAAPGHATSADFIAATPEYFQVMGMPIVAGRGFGAGDAATTPFVVVVNQASADRFFPGQDPIGQTIRILGPAPRTIVGIVSNIRQRRLDGPIEPEIYAPHSQFPTGGMFLVVRARTDDPGRLATSVRAELRSLDRDLPLASMRTGREIIGAGLSSRRFTLTLLSTFAAVALVLAVVGVYGLLSFTVYQRTREIGIRLALGAAARDVQALMLWTGLWPVAIGLAAGMAMALGVARVLTTMLFGVQPSDPLTLVAAAAVLFGASAVAVLWPARRAARIDPLLVLRHE